MKRLIYIAPAAFMMITACSKDFDELNIDPKNPSSAPSYAFFTNAQRQLANTLTSSNVNLNIFRLIVQHWQETQYPEESQYDIGTREINDNMWTALYRDVLRDFEETKNLIPNDVPTLRFKKISLPLRRSCRFILIIIWLQHLEIFRILKHWILIKLPVYDDAATVYDDL